jgi:hypothetical protein
VRIPVLALLVALAAAGTACGDTSTNAPAPPSSTAAVTSLPTYRFTGTGSAPLCAVIDRLLNRSELTVVGTNAVKLQAAVDNYEPFLKQVAAVAPAEVTGDVNTEVAAVEAQLQALRAVDFQLVKVDPKQFDTFVRPNVITAVDRLQAYERQVCHLTASTLVFPTTTLGG